MSFRDNLQHLRATRNMTQEQLAVLVGVSRQSVTKWEAERAYPEMDKLLKLCQIFDCTLDELVQGDLTMREPQPELAVPAAALAEDVVGYDEHQRSYARRISLGAGSCILGTACAAALDGWRGDAPCIAALFLGVGVGLSLILPAAMEHSAFKKAHPYIANFYTDDQRVSERAVYGRRLAVGIVAIFVGLVIVGFAEGRVADNLAGAVFLACTAAGVTLIVWSSLIEDRLDIEGYNISALEDLSEEEIASIVGEDRAPAVLEKVRRNKRKGAVCGIIMILATAIALPLMFWATSYGDPFWIRYFWIPWMVGGLLCGAACVYLDMRG